MAAPASDKNDGSKSESSGGIKAMLPLILNIVLLPVMAFVMTQYVLLPRLNLAGSTPPATEGELHDAPAGPSDDKHADPAAHPPDPSKGSHPPAAGGPHGSGTDKTEMLDGPVTVNVAGTMGSRLAMAKIGLRGTHPKLADLVKDRNADLRDAAASLLCTKTLMDIERQGFRITIKAELKNAFLRVLGPGVFTEVVMPDLAIQ